jgi:hypothetical protein
VRIVVVHTSSFHSIKYRVRHGKTGCSTWSPSKFSSRLLAVLFFEL